LVNKKADFTFKMDWLIANRKKVLGYGRCGFHEDRHFLGWHTVHFLNVRRVILSNTNDFIGPNGTAIE
jgi:hypothetical protein